MFCLIKYFMFAIINGIGGKVIFMLEEILSHYSSETLKKINRLLDDGHDEIISVIEWQYDEENLLEILKIFKKGYNIEIFGKGKFDYDQIGVIELGLENGIDASIYADPKFNCDQMMEIRLGLIASIDVSIYADSKFDWKQMREIKLGLIAGIDVSIYADVRFNWMQMAQIRLKLENGVDVSTICVDIKKEKTMIIDDITEKVKTRKLVKNEKKKNN